MSKGKWNKNKSISKGFQLNEEHMRRINYYTLYYLSTPGNKVTEFQKISVTFVTSVCQKVERDIATKDKESL